MKLDGGHDKLLPSSRAASCATITQEDLAKSADFDMASTCEHIRQILFNLGLADHGYLVPYDLRILCQHLGLQALSPQDLAQLFKQLDSDGDGRISVQDFLAVYPSSKLAPNEDDEENGAKEERAYSPPILPYFTTDRVSDSGNSSLNNVFVPKSNSSVIANGNSFDPTWRLFSEVEANNCGLAKSCDVHRFMENLGVEDTGSFMEAMGFSSSLSISLKDLSTAVHSFLLDKSGEDKTLQAICRILKHEFRHMREIVNESHEQVSHYAKEVQVLNQRNQLLVDELDQNQQTLETKSQQQMKDIEERYQSKMTCMESKYKNEREQWYEEIRNRDELLHQAQQNESGAIYKVRQLERENLKLKAEIDDLSQTISELEGVNLELKSTLEDLSSLRKNRSSFLINPVPLATSSPKSSVKNVSNSRKRKKRPSRPPGPVLTPPLLKRMVKKQKLLLDDSTESESETGFIFERFKTKKPLKRKIRLALVANRIQSPEFWNDDCSPSTSSNESFWMLTNRDNVKEDTASLSLKFNDCCTVINTHLNSLEKHLSDEFKFWIRQLRTDVVDLEMNFENEKKQLSIDYDQKLDQISAQSTQERQQALSQLETDLRKKFESEKRELEIKYCSELNVIERRCAEDKMKLMERLQNEFDVELKRIKSMRFVPQTSNNVSNENEVISGQKQKIDKLMQEQLKLQNRIRCLVDELNYVRTRLNVEEREKLNLKAYTEQIKRDFNAKYLEDRNAFDMTIDRLNADLKAICDDFNSVKRENEALKLAIEASKMETSTQTDETIIVYSPVSLKNMSQNAEPRLDGTVSDAMMTSSSKDLLEITVAVTPVESACEAEFYFDTPGRTELSALNYCQKLSAENIWLVARLSKYRRLVRTLALKLVTAQKQSTKTKMAVDKMRQKVGRLETGVKMDYVRLDAITSALNKLYDDVAEKID